jgi:hypothetical protein
MTRDFEQSNPYFAKVLGFEYFDGPMAGIGILPNRAAQYFKIVAWDEEHDVRLFAIIAISPEKADRVWSAFEAVEPPRLPGWYPQSMGHGDIGANVQTSIEAVRADAECARVEKVVQSHDLTGMTMSVTINDSQAQAIRRMMSDDRLVELGAATILDDFLGLLEA